MAFEISKKIVSARTVSNTPGIAVRLSTSSVGIFRVDVSADTGNTSVVLIGDANVVAAAGSQKGTVLFAGNPSIPIYIDDLSKLYIDVITSGDAITYSYHRDH